MSLWNFVRHPLKSVLTPRLLLLCRHQSQTIAELLDRKAPVEVQPNDELENLPCADTIEWNKKLKAYRMRGEGPKALKLFEVGVRKHRFQPDYITYISMLELCKEIKDVDNGRYVHRHIWNSPVRDNSRIQSLLMEMYMKCGQVDSAREMFEMLKHRTVVEYNALMTAYNANDYPDRTIALFKQMSEKDSVKPNNMSHLLYLQACVKLNSFEEGKALHEELKAKSSAYTKNKELMNQIIAMYIAAGDLPTAEEYFQQVKEPNVANYVALMNHNNQSQKWEQTWQLYERMKAQRKIQPDVPAYLAVLAALRPTKNAERAKQVQEDVLKQNLWQNHAELQRTLSEVLNGSSG